MPNHPARCDVPLLVTRVLLGAALCTPFPLLALDAPPGGDAKPAPAPVATDPSATVVARGHQLYRQRDLDALVLIANRYHHGGFPPADEDQLRHALTRILVARESLLESLESLPVELSHGKIGDAYLLDLLDYQADLNPTPGARAQVAAPEPAAVASVDGPVLIALPPLALVRTIDGVGKRQLSIQIALRFADQATSRRYEPQAAVIRDAILGYMDGVSSDFYLEPKQGQLKQGLVAAITSQIPGFPANAVLIPQLDASLASSDTAPAASPPVKPDAPLLPAPLENKSPGH
jgi:hypothetical protein